jgi:hypothetical protein
MTPMAPLPQISDELLQSLAQAEGVCIRPLLHKITDTTTGQLHVVPIRCGSTREAVCPPCAQRNRWLRMQQCREGWHLDTEPEIAVEPDQSAGDDQADNAQDDENPRDDEAVDAGRRVRSTRRRQDVPDLPCVPVESRTIGRVFEEGDGRRFRPSVFATFTLPSYGRVGSDGTPVDRDRYDYRGQALDAMHFPKLIDRLWQNLRRATGYRVQYFAAVEPQRRLAPHLHAAIRGAIPRRVFREVVAATYHQVWWPAFDYPVFTDQLPVWSGDEVGYVDPDTGVPLPTWDEALDALDDELDADPAHRPAHVVRFGTQLDLQGIIATSSDADRRVGYLTKYLTKAVADTYGDPDEVTAARAAHLSRLHEEVRWLPCTPTCWNWVRYGIQPAHAHEGMEPGECPGRAHRWENLGCGGRRVLVSRLWTGKTLADHQADRATVVREALAAAGIVMPDADRYSATATDPDGRRRFVWAPIDPAREDPAMFRQAILLAVQQRRRWRTEYQTAKTQLQDRGNLSATGPPDIGGEAA